MAIPNRNNIDYYGIWYSPIIFNNILCLFLDLESNTSDWLNQLAQPIRRNLENKTQNILKNGL